MGNITNAINAAFRDFVTDGVSSSGAHEVVKSDVRAVGPIIENALANVALGALVDVTKDTKAALDADLAHGANTVALVYADAADANNDLWLKSGASGAGSWANTGILHDAIAGVAQPFADAAAASAAEAVGAASDLTDRLSAVEVFGRDVTSAPSGAGLGTYTFSRAIGYSGKGVSLTYYGTGTGTAYLQIVDRAGITNTIEQEHAFSVVPGLQVVDFPEVTFEAGQHFGFRSPAGLIGITTGTEDVGLGGYWSSGTVTAGSSYDDASISFLDFRLKFEFTRLGVTGDSFAALQSDVAALGAAVGDTVAVEVFARPADAVLTSGTLPLGGSIYAFERTATQDSVLTKLRIYATSAGAATLTAYSGTPEAIVAERSVSVPLSVGENVITDISLTLLTGERLAIQKGTANIALTTGASTDATPYRSVVGATLGALNSTLRFEMSAEFSTYALTQRLEALEELSENPAFAHETESLIMVWMLGESHASGRATTFPTDLIPVGRGYQYRRSTTSVAHLVEPTSNEAVTTGSWGQAIGKTLLDATRGAVGAYIINSGVGGTKIGDWEAADSVWTNAAADIAAAKTAAKTSKLSIGGAVINIALGTNDLFAGTATATFKTGMIDLFARARTALGAGSNVPIILFMTPPYVNSSYDAAVLAYQQAIAELVREQPNVYLATNATKHASLRGWFKADNIHFNDAGNEAVGASVAMVAQSRGLGLYPAGLE